MPRILSNPGHCPFITFLIASCKSGVSVFAGPGCTLPHCRLILLHCPPTARSPGMNTTVFTYMLQFASENSLASQPSLSLATKLPHPATPGMLKHCGDVSLPLDDGNSMLTMAFPRHFLGPRSLSNIVTRMWRSAETELASDWPLMVTWSVSSAMRAPPRTCRRQFAGADIEIKRIKSRLRVHRLYPISRRCGAYNSHRLLAN